MYSGGIFTTGKYQIKTMEIIFYCLYQTFLDLQFSYFTKRSSFGSSVISEGYSKKPTAKILDFALRNQGEEGEKHE